MSVVSVVFCQVEVSRRADSPFRGVLPTVVRRVLSRNLVNEEAMAHWGGCRAQSKQNL